MTAAVLALLVALAVLTVLGGSVRSQVGAPAPGDTVYWDMDASGNVTASDIILAGPDAGTLVQDAYPGLGAMIEPLVLSIGVYDADADATYSAADGLYLDHGADSVVSVGDLRSSREPFGTVVASGDADEGSKLSSVDGPPPSTLVYVDVNGDGRPGPVDAFYWAPGPGSVGVLDVRVTSTGGFAPGTLVRGSDPDLSRPTSSVPGLLGFARYQPPTPAPAIESVQPSVGVCGETSSFSVFGQALGSVRQVTLGDDVRVGIVRAVDDTRVDTQNRILDGAVPGTRTVTVTGADGTAALPGGFTVRCPTPGLPDLVIESIVATADPSEGVVAVTVGIANRGAMGSPATEVEGRISGDPDQAAIGPVVQVARARVPALAPNATANVTVELPASVGPQEQAYAIDVQVDPDSLVEESNEENNRQLTQAIMPAVAHPDLLLTDVAWELVDDGRTMVVTATLRNIGHAAAPRTIAEASLDGNQAQRSVAGLVEPGQSAPLRFEIALPDERAGQTVRVDIEADATRLVEEADETNNVQALSVLVPASEEDGASLGAWLVGGLVVVSLVGGVVWLKSSPPRPNGGRNGPDPVSAPVAMPTLARATLTLLEKVKWQGRARDAPPEPRGCPVGARYCQREVQWDVKARRVRHLTLAWTASDTGEHQGSAVLGHDELVDLNVALVQRWLGAPAAHVHALLLRTAEELAQQIQKATADAKEPRDVTVEARVEGSTADATFTLYKCQQGIGGTMPIKEHMWKATVSDAFVVDVLTLKHVHPSEGGESGLIDPLLRGLEGLLGACAWPAGVPTEVELGWTWE